MRRGLVRPQVLYGGFAAWIAVALVTAVETYCLAGVAWIALGSSVLAPDVARWSRGATNGLGIDEGAFLWIARIGGGVVGVIALVLVIRRIA